MKMAQMVVKTYKMMEDIARKDNEYMLYNKLYLVNIIETGTDAVL